MTFKTIKQLLLEKAVLDSKIRAYRVKEIRATVARAISASHDVKLGVLNKLGHVNTLIESVHYVHGEVDDLLYAIEDLLED